MRKLPRLYEYSERVYADCKKIRKKGEEEDAWAAAFCYVLAPVLFLYVLWVLADALWGGKRRLYFLARDGYMMYSVAEYVCRKWQLPLECRYLYCSRYSLRGGEYKLLGERGLDYICLGGMQVTLERMMLRGGLTAEEAAEAGRYMGREHDLHKLLSYEQVKGLGPELKANPVFMGKMKEHAEAEYPRVIGYLRQEGLLDSVPYAIVDSGWTGSVQRSMERLLRSAGYKGKIEGYCFGMYEYVKGTDPGRCHTWYFSPGRKNWKKAFFCNNLFECVFSSPEGMVKGYRREGGRYVPVFAPGGNPNRGKIVLGEKILRRYAEYYTGEAGDKDRPGRDMRMEMRVAARLLHSFMGCPSAEEARVFGGYLFDDDAAGEEMRPLARAFTDSEADGERIVRKLYRYAAGKEHPVLQSGWPEASMVLSGKGSAGALAQIALYKFLLNFRKGLGQGKRG